VLILLSENENLKSTVRILQENQDNMDLLTTQQKVMIANLKD
jgi:hypothetical protein